MGINTLLLDKICEFEEGLRRQVLESVLTLALEIAQEGRGGGKAGPSSWWVIRPRS